MSGIPLPAWATELRTLYESGAASQFVLHGNVHDRMLLPLPADARLGSLSDFLLEVLLPRFDVILSYDLGHGIRVEKGQAIFSEWPTGKQLERLPRKPGAAMDTLTHFLRYAANLRAIRRRKLHVALVVEDAQLVCPAVHGGVHHELSSLAVTIRDWSESTDFVEHPLATFLVTENVNDLHPLIANNPRASWVEVPLPAPVELQHAFSVMAPQFPQALENYASDLATPAAQLAGATLAAVEAMLRTREHASEALSESHLADLKKELVEKDCNGLIEFIESDQTLDDLYGQERIKTHLRQDLALWRQNDVEALPMGYLLSGPVGTGKTFLVKCLAGEAGVPVVKIKNFRDKWVGSSEGNLEKIFRLLHALGRCIVFVDEADQALGKRDAGNSDSGLSGRIYSMVAQEMSNTRNRGKIVWVLASSRPDLIEIDLKRPGRVDVKIPIFPATDPIEGGLLIKALCKRRGLDLSDEDLEALRDLVPYLLTPGAAESLAVKAYRLVRTESISPREALVNCLTDYRSPVPREIIDFQIRLALKETTDIDFVPPRIREEFA